MTYPIETLRRVVAWADDQREDWWMPANRTAPSAQGILLAFELVVDRCGVDTIEVALQLTVEAGDAGLLYELCAALCLDYAAYHGRLLDHSAWRERNPV